MSDWLAPAAGVGTLFGGLAASAIAWRQDRRKAPIEVESASVLNAKTAGELALQLIDQLQEQLKTQSERIERLERGRDEDRSRIDALEDDRSVLVEWVRSILSRWHLIRTEERAPEPPGVRPWI